MLQKLKLTFMVPLLLILAGCGGSRVKYNDFGKISIGMSKEQVRNKLGEPNIIRGATSDNQGNVTDLWQYHVSVPGMSLDRMDAMIPLVVCTCGLALPLVLCTHYHTEIYWLYFMNSELAQWGQPQDWQKTPNFVQEVRLR